MNDTPTPRTNAKIKDGHRVPHARFYDDNDYPLFLPVAFARTLETDLATALRERDEANRLFDIAQRHIAKVLGECDTFTAERDAALAELERARKDSERLDWCQEHGTPLMWETTLRAAIDAAKEQP